MKFAILGVAALGAIFLTGCRSDSARISGRFTGCDSGTVYLSEVLPGQQRVVDSASVSRKGAFEFKVRLPEGEPTLYNLSYEGAVIPLCLARGERARVSSLCDVALNYAVEGSPESERIRELRMLLVHGAAKLDSMRRLILNAGSDTQREIYAEYVREMNRIKREHISFIVSQPASLSSHYALYQRLAGQTHIFNERSDILYYRLVADSTGVAYPESPYVAALRKEVDKADNALNVNELIAEKLAADRDGFPDLHLPDIVGTEHSLSDFEGRVIVLDFWHSSDPAARLNNAELRALYDKFHDSGLEIYQVSLDTQKAKWIASVQAQKLPWTTVSDLRGVSSPAVALYNIDRLPANYIIDRGGNIAARDLFGEELAATIERLL